MAARHVSERRADDVIAQVTSLLEDAFFFEDVDAGNCGRAGQRVARIREATEEDLSVVGRRDLARDDHSAKRNISRVDTLGERDEVGLGTPVLPCEPLPGTAEPGHHLVGDHHDAELVAHRADTLEVAVGRDEDTVRADDGFEHYRGDLVSALEHDGVAQVRQCPVAFLLGRLGVERRPVRVWPPELDEARHSWLVRKSSWLTRKADGHCRAAVVAAIRGQHLQAARVTLGQPNSVLHRFGAGVREEDLLEVAIGPRRARTVAVRSFDDQSGGLAALVVGEPRADHAQNFGLVFDRLDHLRVLMPEVHVDQLAREVDPGIAVSVPHLRAEGARHHHRIECSLSGPRMEDAGTVVGVGAFEERRRVCLELGHIAIVNDTGSCEQRALCNRTKCSAIGNR